MKNNLIKVIVTIFVVIVSNFIIVFAVSIKTETRKLIKIDNFSNDNYYLVRFNKDKFKYKMTDRELRIIKGGQYLSLDIENKSELDEMLVQWDINDDNLIPPENCSEIELRISHQLESSYRLTTAFLGTQIKCI